MVRKIQVEYEINILHFTCYSIHEKGLIKSKFTNQTNFLVEKLVQNVNFDHF